MPRVDVVVQTPIDAASFRVQQIAGMFDVPVEARASETFSVVSTAKKKLHATSDFAASSWGRCVVSATWRG